MTNNLEELRTRVKEVIRCIHADNYYIPIWELSKHDKDVDLIDNTWELLEPFQDFWERLPDDSDIRRYPFFQICDLAEEFCEIQPFH